MISDGKIQVQVGGKHVKKLLLGSSLGGFKIIIFSYFFKY